MDTAVPTASGDIAASTGSATASPSVSTDSTQTAAPATQATPNPITDTTSTGEPPKERWNDILANARTKEREAAQAEWREKYGWAESVKREELEQMAQWYATYQGDPSEFLERAYTEALNHPIHGATVKSRVGKLLSSMRTQPQQEPTFEPDVPVMDANGQIVTRTYSADLVKQMLAHEIQKSLNPYKEDLETRKSQAQKADEKAQSESLADQHIEHVKQMPWFDEYKADIKQVFDANRGMSLLAAYEHVLKTKIYPSIGQKSEAKVLSDLQLKANAATVNPGMPTGTGPKKFKNFDEAIAYYAEHPDEAEAMAHR